MSDAAPKDEVGQPPSGKPRRLGKAPKSLLKTAIVLGVALVSDPVFKGLEAEHIVDMREFNDHLKNAVSKFNPASMATHFSSRLRDEYGWRLFSFSAPFNLTEARRKLLKEYPLVARRSEFLVRVNMLTGEKSMDDTELIRQLAAYRDELAKINHYKFPYWMPRFVSKIFGLPDATMFMVRGIFAGSLLTKVIGCLTLVIVLGFLFSPRCRSLPGAIMLLPLFTTLIAWLLFLPVLLAARVLDWIVLLLFGSPMNAPETSVVASLGSLWPINWATQKLTEHHLTEVLLKKVDDK